MIALDYDLQKLQHYREWCDICERVKRETETARELVDYGEYPLSALILLAHAHPGRTGQYYVGQAIDSQAKRQSKSARLCWWRATCLIRVIHGTRHCGRRVTFDQAMVRVRRRYPVTSRKAGFLDAARRVWERAELSANTPWRYELPDLRPTSRPLHPVAQQIIGMHGSNV